MDLMTHLVYEDIFDQIKKQRGQTYTFDKRILIQFYKLTKNRHVR
jgi:hypothetical protein